MSYAKNSSTFKVSAIIDPNVNEDSKLYKDNIQNTIVKNGPKNPMSEVYLPAGFPTLFENGRIISRTNKFPHYSEDVTVESYKTTIGTIVKSGWSSKTLLELYIKNDYTPVIDSKNQLTEFKISETGSIEAIKVRADQSHVISVLMNMGNTQNNSNRLLEMGIKFSYPKPQTLLQYLVGIIPNKKIIILDIFAGSGTTLHATMQLNDDDGGNRQCILVTNNEIDEKTQKELEIKGLVKGTPEFEAYGICQSVTYERNRRVIQGYTNSKGEWVNGLTNNNLRYYKSELVGREPSLKNKRELTRLATELLCIKEDCYDEQEIAIKQAKLFANGKVMLLVLFDDHIIPNAVEFIKKQINGIILKVYVFSMGSDPYTEDFYEVSDKIVCALPDAIYKAYRSVLPKNKRFIIADDEKMEDQMNKE